MVIAGTVATIFKPVSEDNADKYEPAIILPISPRAEYSISPKSASGAESVPINKLTILCAESTLSKNIIVPVMSPSMPNIIPTITISSDPIMPEMSLSGTRATFGTFMSIFMLIICDSAVVALPAPILPISLSTSNCISVSVSRLISGISSPSFQVCITLVLYH